jgi:hypothetical protein
MSSVGNSMFRSSINPRSRSHLERQPTKKTQPLSRFDRALQLLLLTSAREAEAHEPVPEKTEAQIQEEIQAIFRQITASVTFLPVLDGNCTFNVLVYADADSDVPIEWGDSDSKEIKNGEKVQLRSFSTSNHRVDTMVSYRLAD